MRQHIITAEENNRELDQWIRTAGKILLVCDPSIRYQQAFCAHLDALEKTGTQIVRFDDFQPNPLYESVVKGVALFQAEGCGGILAVGGGSAMDVAKCIKLFCRMDPAVNYLEQEIVPNEIPFLAMPTTAGTGSEATRYAVIYFQGAKQSVTSESCIPGTVLLDPACLNSLPEYQRKATMMDALCHGIESFWSVNRTEESREFSRQAIRGVMTHMEGYLANTAEGNAGMLRAAHTAGRAINITQTTAGHAMCYKITSLFGVAHGHAAMLCDRVLYPWMIQHAELCTDPRGVDDLRGALDEIGICLGENGAKDGAEKLREIFDSLHLAVPEATKEQFEILRISVNPVRLKNHPIRLDTETMDGLYHRILRSEMTILKRG